MERGKWLVTFARALALVFGLWSLLAAGPALDLLTLKGGRVVQGRVVGETDSQVQLSVDGVVRNYDRDFIEKIDYGGEDAAPTALSGPDDGPPPPRGDALAASLSERYQVPESSVFWVRRQGLPDSDLEPVFEIASEARVPLRAVVGLRVRGWTWRAIRARYGLLSSPPPPPEAVVVVAPPPPLILRILLFPLFIFGFHWHG